MSEKKRNGIALFANADRPAARELTDELSGLLKNLDIPLYAEKAAAALCQKGRARVCAPSDMARRARLAVVIGGDGTLLRASHYAAPAGLPLLGVNVGRLGYVTSVSASDLLWAVREALKGRLKRDARVMLRCQVIRKGRVVADELALNDIVITRAALGRMVVLDAFVDRAYLTTYRCDGLILATPTGSTAYALSVGGPILNPRLTDYLLAPIAPHTLSNRPLVLADTSVVEVAIPASQASLIVSSDGQKCLALKPGDKIRVARAKEKTILLVPRNQSYWEILRSKLGWGG